MSGKNLSPLTPLFSPRSVAVIGASRHAKKIGHIVLQNLRDGHFPDGLYPINPEAKTIDGLTCYPTVESLPIIPDLAIIVIPAAYVIPSVSAAARHGIKNFVVLSAGFKEIGNEGLTRELALRELAHTYHLNIIGPNCLGFLNARDQVNATFGQRDHIVGNVHMVSQSGAMATGLFDWAKSAGVGLDDVITLGNKAMLSENDILRYWHDTDQPTSHQEPPAPIGLYLESIEHGEEFIALARELSLTHPLILLKPGKSEAAQRAIQSHTGALAQSDAVLSTALRTAGVIRAEGVEDLFDLIHASAWTHAPMGPRVAIISNAGGPAVIATDLVHDLGLTLAPLSKKTHHILATHLPREANIANPIDVLGDALSDRYATALSAVLSEPTVDAVVVILTPQVMTQIEATATIIAAAARVHHKTIVCSFMGGSHIVPGERVLNYYHIPSFRYPERAVRTLASLWQWRSWQQTQKNTEHHTEIGHHLSFDAKKHLVHSIRQARKDKQTVLPSLESTKLLSTLGVSVPPSQSVSSMVSAVQFANRHGYPLVLKISSPNLAHKTDAKGVITNISSHVELHAGLRALQKTIRTLGLEHDTHTTIQIQKQITGGIEVIVGMKRDPQFGPVWLIGAGGIMAELFGDTSLLLPPFSASAVAAWIERTHIAKLLHGYRGDAPYAVHALTHAITQLLPLGLMEDIIDVTLNPLIVTHKDVYAVDARITLSEFWP